MFQHSLTVPFGTVAGCELWRNVKFLLHHTRRWVLFVTSIISFILSLPFVRQRSCAHIVGASLSKEKSHSKIGQRNIRRKSIFFVTTSSVESSHGLDLTRIIYHRQRHPLSSHISHTQSHTLTHCTEIPYMMKCGIRVRTVEQKSNEYGSFLDELPFYSNHCQV